MAIRKHPGINQKTGRLKKGWKWGTNGNPVKAGTATKRKTSTKKKRTSGKRKPAGLVSKVKRKVKALGRKLGA